MISRIRRASNTDVAALALLAERTFRETFAKDNEPDDMEAYLRESFHPRRVAAEIDDAANTFLLAEGEEGGGPIGYAKLRAGEAEASVRGPAAIEIERLYAAPEAIGRGVGAALMRACMAEARRAGGKTLWLGVWEHNERAIAFYRRWGFETVGTHVFVLGSDEQTDLVMELPLR